jgi:hypothetical protein
MLTCERCGEALTPEWVRAISALHCPSIERLPEGSAPTPAATLGVEALVMRYGELNFACGEYDMNTRTTAGYAALADEAKAIFATIRAALHATPEATP